MEINGSYEGPSGSRAMARHKYKTALAAKENGVGKEAGGEGGNEMEGAKEKLAAVHGEHASKATKSFHVYQHEDGKFHSHAHDHEAKTHEHREHEDMGGVVEHLHSHLGGLDKTNEAAPKADVESGGMGDEGGMASLGLGAPPEEE